MIAVSCSGKFYLINLLAVITANLDFWSARPAPLAFYLKSFVYSFRPNFRFNFNN